MDLKSPLASPTFTGTVGLPSTTSIGLVSATEISYVDGATSNLQDQITALSVTGGDSGNGYVAIATAAGTTTLLVGSVGVQNFTGTTTQTVTLPVVSTLTTGWVRTIHNNSTGIVTVQSSGANTVIAMPADTHLIIRCILITGTTAASWDYVLSPLSESKSGVIGTATNDNAGTGRIGEFISSGFVSGVSLTSAIFATVTSISLTAGDWDVRATIQFLPAVTTTTSRSMGGINPLAATISALSTDADMGRIDLPFAGSAGGPMVLPIQTVRVSLSGSATYYLNAYLVFAVSTATVGGILVARRIR